VPCPLFRLLRLLLPATLGPDFSLNRQQRDSASRHAREIYCVLLALNNRQLLVVWNTVYLNLGPTYLAPFKRQCLLLVFVDYRNNDLTQNRQINGVKAVITPSTILANPINGGLEMCNINDVK